MPTSVQCSWIELDVPDPAPGVPRTCPTCSGQTSSGTRAIDGQINVSTPGPTAQGYGYSWGHSLTNANQFTYSGSYIPTIDQGFGYGWVPQELPYIVPSGSNLAAVNGATSAVWFSNSPGYAPLIGQQATLQYDATNLLYVMTDEKGGVSKFNDLNNATRPGGFVSYTAPGGMQFSVTATDGPRVTEMQRTVTVNSITTIQSLLYTYSTGPCPPRLSSVQLRTNNGSGWSPVSQTLYNYYGDSESFGQSGDLKTAELQFYNGTSWQSQGTSYYRYYLDNSHGLQYAVKPGTYQRMVADGFNPLTVDNNTLGSYADDYFAYDASRRCTTHMLQGGSRVFSYVYSTSGFATGVNSWSYLTVETRPDGSTYSVYSNYLGFTMLEVLQSGASQWCDFYVYDNNCRVLLHAHPSAIIGFDATKPDLLNKVAGNYQYLRDSAGLIDTYTYHVSGFVANSYVQQGELGTPVILRHLDYVACGCSSSSSSSAGGSSSSSSASGAPCIWFVSQQTDYLSATDPSQTAITQYAYTFYSGTCAVQQVITTLPVVSTAQNGSGVANTSRVYYDIFGNQTWSMDERGYLTRMAYDIITGGVVQQTDDANVASYSDAPAGWTTPASGGLNVVTDFTVDTLSRRTQTLRPVHPVDLGGVVANVRTAAWTYYDDVNYVVYSAAGYYNAENASYTLVNPVSITKLDASGRVNEQIQAASSTTAGTLAAIIGAAGGGAAAFPQSSYTRWTTFQYTDCCLAASQRVYKQIPSSGIGVSGTNYDQTNYGYDTLKRRVRTITPGGTITWNVLDPRGLTLQSFVGTNDTNGTDTDPTGGGTGGNNMVLVFTSTYDGGSAGGDGNLTTKSLQVDASTTRVTTFTYDFRNRQVTMVAPIDYTTTTTYDNLDRVTRTQRFAQATGNLINQRDSIYDALGRVYQSIVYAVDPSTGAVGNALTDNSWFDQSGNLIKSLPAGSSMFTKTTFDSLGRTTVQYAGYGSDANYAAIFSVANNTILEQTESVYDNDSNLIQSIRRQRYHNAAASQLGGLGNPGIAPNARVTYQPVYPDAVGRAQATADYGTNGGSALVRSSTIPVRSDTCLLASQTYDSSGATYQQIDPKGLVTQFAYDAAGREITRIQNPSGSSSSSSSSSSSRSSSSSSTVPAFTCPVSNDVAVTVQRTYNADGNLATLTAVNSVTGNQTTTYGYGATLGTSAIASSLLKVSETYPDSVGGSDQIAFTYNRQNEITTMTDQNGTVHQFVYDGLGRQTQDCVTTLGTGVDGAIRRIARAYEARGMTTGLTSYDNPTVGAGSVVNDVQFAYNTFGQLISDAQEHGGAVGVGTPKVQYGYANGSTNTIRPTTLTYPNGRVITSDYGTAGGFGDQLSRVASLIDQDSTHLADYSYLGLGTFVVTSYAQPNLQYTLVGTAGGNDPDTGDIYRGFDRFGRVTDAYWYNVGTATDAARIQYGYDRASNRTYRYDVVAHNNSAAFDEIYDYDAVQRLKDMARGTLNATRTALTSETFAQCWTLDETGNWSGFRQDNNGDGLWDLVQARTSNPVNEITNIANSTGSAWITPAYNPAGNMTTMPQPASPGTSYTAIYDAWNRLTNLSASGTIVSSYTYDGAKRRIVQLTYTGGLLTETRHFFYTQPSMWHVLEERIGTTPNTATMDRHFIWGLRYIDDLVLRDRTTGSGILNERFYSMQDGNWNVIAIADANAGIKERYAYLPYGTVTFLTPMFSPQLNSQVSFETLYCSYRREDTSGLFHVRNRTYHPQNGAWNTRDPIRYRAGPNLFAYSVGNPIDFIDPYGLSTYKCTCKCITHRRVTEPFTSYCIGNKAPTTELWPTFFDAANLNEATTKCKDICNASAPAIVKGCEYVSVRALTPDEAKVKAMCCGDLECEECLRELMWAINRPHVIRSNRCFDYMDGVLDDIGFNIDATFMDICNGKIRVAPQVWDPGRKVPTSPHPFGGWHVMKHHAVAKVTFKCSGETAYFDIGSNTHLGHVGGDDHWFFPGDRIIDAQTQLPVNCVAKGYQHGREPNLD